MYQYLSKQTLRCTFRQKLRCKVFPLHTLEFSQENSHKWWFQTWVKWSTLLYWTWSKLTGAYIILMWFNPIFLQKKQLPNFSFQPYSHKKTAPRGLEMLQEQPRIRWEVPLEAPLVMRKPWVSTFRFQHVEEVPVSHTPGIPGKPPKWKEFRTPEIKSWNWESGVRSFRGMLENS